MRRKKFQVVRDNLYSVLTAPKQVLSFFKTRTNYYQFCNQKKNGECLVACCV